ncbi:vWA domain-containing protein [Jannaschia pohangensis]|uniref:Ca-activated chloride channel family protein n=1 Tax=Jannaschia pohangensis TaxID=390807 RepID=A0A1I3RU98_9RHOB|nr:vWA domain-containing protein [Jannaschia pohangensis]SFJ50134.1 Ca-activated chloride channel family protein [Jannaschia pohangensis]
MRIALALTCSLALPAWAQAPCSTDAMVVFDGSASMAEIGFDTGETNRITDARAAMARVMPDVEDFRRIGLVTYGPGPEGSCEGIRLRFPPIESAAARMIAEIDALEPTGLTPLTDAVERAAEVLDYRLKPAIVVLVTDGNETCGGRPCALGRALEATGADLTVHVIGYKAESDFFSWDNPEADEVARGDTVAKCLSDTTGGQFVATDTVDELVEALRATLGCALVGRL